MSYAGGLTNLRLKLECIARENVGGLSWCETRSGALVRAVQPSCARAIGVEGGHNVRRWRSGVERRCLAVLIGLLAAGGAVAVAAESTLTVVVADGDSLRSLAHRYLDDPNLWRDILRSSGLESAAEVRAGMELRIPRTEISVATTALEEARAAQQRASAAGARVFAATTIEASIAARREALELRQAGRWADCTVRAREATQRAERAREETLAARSAAAEAVLRSRVGTAQGRQPKELDWSQRSAGDRLIEQERLRTLSDSNAVIMFADESRLRLGPNSQAVIQKMRIDALDHRQEASVSLERGEVFGLLDSTGTRNAFEVKAPGVTTDSVSSDFWIGQKGEETKIANYDTRGMRVTSAGGTVRLLKNQGTVVQQGEAPTAPWNLLPAPALTSPDQGASIEADRAALSWREVERAASYNVVVASDPSLKDVVETANVVDRALNVSELEDGTYYWAVSAVDSLHFPGPASHVRRFRVTRPRSPAFLAVSAPADGAVLQTPRVEVRGAAQPGAELIVDGQRVELARGGEFAVERQLRQGVNPIQLEVTARDGSSAVRTVTVDYRPAAPVPVRWSDDLLRLEPGGPFLTGVDRWRGGGICEPGAKVEVRGSSDRVLADALADDSGRFSVLIPVAAGRNALSVVARARSGQETRHDLTVIVDRQPPQIEIDDLLPERTGAAMFRMSGTVNDPEPTAAGLGGVEVAVDGRRAPLDGDRFAVDLSLREGRHELEVAAVDAVGNRSVRRHVVTVDRSPPVIEEISVVERTDAVRSVVEVQVMARDASPLRRSAWLELIGNRGTVRVPLRLDPTTSRFRGHVVGVSPDALVRVVVEDVVGNRRGAPLGSR